MSTAAVNAPEVVCMGEILIDFMGAPSGRPLDDAETFERKPGGAPANVAVGVSRLGRASAFVGMVGDDAFGRFLTRTLEEEQVDTRSLAVSTAQPTTLAFVAKDDRGVPSFSFYRHPGADLSLRPEDIDMRVFEQARFFHFGSLSLVAPPARDSVYHCLDAARARQIAISYDPNYRPALWRDAASARERMLEPLGHVDILKVSEEELLLLAGEDDPREACAALAAQGPQLIIVTRGEQGLFGWNQGEIMEVPGKPVEVVDTTGCGDSSMAGILTWLLEQDAQPRQEGGIPSDTLEAALNFANHCAAITATKLGAIPALPRRDEVQI